MEVVASSRRTEGLLPSTQRRAWERTWEMGVNRSLLEVEFIEKGLGRRGGGGRVEGVVARGRRGGEGRWGGGRNEGIAEAAAIWAHLFLEKV